MTRKEVKAEVEDAECDGSSVFINSSYGGFTLERLRIINVGARNVTVKSERKGSVPDIFTVGFNSITNIYQEKA